MALGRRAKTRPDIQTRAADKGNEHYFMRGEDETPTQEPPSETMLRTIGFTLPVTRRATLGIIRAHKGGSPAGEP